ncbi:hypothetical protein Tco_0991094 [Tanacetum coccineum]|uniref:DNA-directed primase/polymerase protein n=1 Tax=Tanacetum coccineum TaxID=301880 RepID=A0ABQ5EZH0_9ASTR
MTSRTRRMLFSKISTQIDTYTDDDDNEDLYLEKNPYEYDDEIENDVIECESKIDNFKGKEDHVSEERKFLVSTYKEFWRRYKNMNCKFCHHYEVIQEGMPCHFYFDLEFNIKENAAKNGDEMVDLPILIIFECLLEKYSIEGDTN